MKNIKFSKLLVMFLAAGSWMSCSDINKKQSEWTKGGEDIYVGKIEVLARGGLNKIQLEGSTEYASSAVKCLVTINSSDPLEYALSEIATHGKMLIFYDDMDEGSYTFKVQTFDDQGNSSLVTQCLGTVYGENFIMSQSPKRINSTEIMGDGLQLTWNYSEDAVKVIFTYATDDEDHPTETLEMDGTEEVTKIRNWGSEGEYEIITYVMPEKDALETIALPGITGHFPFRDAEFLMDRTRFTHPADAVSDATQGYGGSYEALWDNVIDGVETGFFHSADGVGVPHHATIDMGGTADLTKIMVLPRWNGKEWNPVRFQIWGCAEFTDTTVPSMEDAWEADAIDKGWIKLLEADMPYTTDYYRFATIDEATEKCIFDLDPETATGMRYIRYRVLEVTGTTGSGSTGYPKTGTGAYSLLYEIRMWGTYFTTGE